MNIPQPLDLLVFQITLPKKPLGLEFVKYILINRSTYGIIPVIQEFIKECRSLTFISPTAIYRILPFIDTNEKLIAFLEAVPTGWDKGQKDALYQALSAGIKRNSQVAKIKLTPNVMQEVFEDKQLSISQEPINEDHLLSALFPT